MFTQLTDQPVQAITPQLTALITARGPLGRARQRILQAFHEMNYATRRVVEVQAPWIVDKQWHNRPSS